MMRIIKISKKVQSSSTRILSTRESFRRGERKGREGHERREGGGWMDEWLDVADYRSGTPAGLVWAMSVFRWSWRECRRRSTGLIVTRTNQWLKSDA